MRGPRGRAARAVIASAFIVACAASGCAGPAEVVVPAAPVDAAVWDRVTSHPEPTSLGAGTRGLVLPHHLCDLFQLAGAWSEAGRLAPSALVVISPRHDPSAGPDISVGSRLAFQTPFGELRTDARLSERIRRALPFPCLDDAGFLPEHGIFNHAPYVKRFLPRVRFVPIIVKQGTDRPRLDALVRAVAAALPADGLVVASVDFSHYNMSRVSAFHDAASAASILAMDGDSIFTREIDSPESVYAVMRLMEGRGASRAVVFGRTDLQDYLDKPISDNTSHLYVSFSEGRPAAEPLAALMAFPRRGAEAAPDGVLESWTWSWRDPRRSDEAYPGLSRLKGEEDRFLMGSDLYLFGPPEGGSKSYRVRGMEIRVVGVDAGAKAELNEAGRRAVADAASGGARVVVLLDAEREIPAEGLRRMGLAAACLVVQRPRSGKARVYSTEGTAVAVLPGSLCSGPGPSASRDSGILAARVGPGSVECELWPISHDSGRPYLSDLPAAASTDPPPSGLERE